MRISRKKTKELRDYVNRQGETNRNWWWEIFSFIYFFRSQVNVLEVNFTQRFLLFSLTFKLSFFCLLFKFTPCLNTGCKFNTLKFSTELKISLVFWCLKVKLIFLILFCLNFFITRHGLDSDFFRKAIIERFWVKIEISLWWNLSIFLIYCSKYVTF